MYLAFNHDRPAFKGPGQIPLKKAINYAIDRPALARVFGYLGGKRTDQILPPALGARGEHLSARRAEPRGCEAHWYARARLKPTTLVYYTTNAPASVVQAQILEFNLKQLGIDLEVKYFDAGTLLEKIAHPRRAVRHRRTAGRPTTPTEGRSSRRFSTAGASGRPAT